MKQILIVMVFFMSAMSMKAQESSQDSVISPDSKEDIVINMSMIKKYQEATYTADMINISELIANYSFNDIKLITQAYNKGDIEISSIETIDKYLAGVNAELNNDTDLKLQTGKNDLASN